MGTETLIMIKHETPCSSRVLMNHKRAQARVECAAEVASSSSSAFSSPIFNAFAFVRCLPPSKAVSAVRSASASSSVVSRRPRPSASRRFVRYYCFTASGCFVALWRRISSLLFSPPSAHPLPFLSNPDSRFPIAPQPPPPLSVSFLSPD